MNKRVRQLDLGQAARLLNDAADYFRIRADQLAGQTGDEGAVLRANAEAFVAASRRLGTPVSTLPDYHPAASLAWHNGPWLRRRRFLGAEPDRPFWVQEGASTPGALWTEVAAEADEWRAVAKALAERSFQLGPSDRVHVAAPTFLTDVTLAHVERRADFAWDAFFSIESTRAKDGSLTRTARSFDFKSAEVHRLNAVSPIDTVGHELAYLRYFMYVVRGEEGAFYLLEGPVWDLIRPFVAERLRKRRGAAASFRIRDVEPPRFSHVAANGGIVFTAWVLYADAIFQTELAVLPNGMVEMLSDSARLDAIPGVKE